MLRAPRRPVIITAILLATLTPVTTAPMNTPNVDELQAMTARFAPVDMKVDLSALPPNERQALGKLVEAGRLIDGLFLDQVWAGNAAMLQELARDRSPLGQARLHYFLINKGPWSRLDHNAPFIPGAPAKPEPAGFYPADATKNEVEAWIQSLPEPARREASGFFTVIRRDAARKLVAVPYSQAYQPTLELIATKLREAAALTQQPTLRRFLETRAAAFRSNDYYDSDVAWMELDASIEPTIGPYEVYEDEWFNYKAGYEAFITIRDAVESDKLKRFGAELQALENALPIDPKYRNPKLGALSPIAVVNLIFAGGDGNHAVQTAAFNLPNDERVIEAKGAKRVMLKNVQEAKFQQVLLPISRVTLPGADQSKVAFDAFFTHILMHELMHGLGPQSITVNGRATSVRQELKETYSTIEEAKADVSGLWALQRLVDGGRLERQLEDTMYLTFLASSFRSIRFGINEAHGRGVAIQVNKFLDAGAIVANADGTFGLRMEKMKTAIVDLTRELMTIEAEGRYENAKTLLSKYAVVRPEVQRALDRLRAVPVDIEPRFVTAEELEGLR